MPRRHRGRFSGGHHHRRRSHSRGRHGHGHGHHGHHGHRSPSPSPTRTGVIRYHRARGSNNRAFLDLFRNRARGPNSIFAGGNYNIFNYGHVGSPDSDDDTDDEEDQAFAAGASGGRRPREPEPEPEVLEVLSVKNVDFQFAWNCRQHHTDEYDITEGPRPKLVVRRGQPFSVRLEFNRPYDTSKDDLRLVFEIGDNPKTSKGTHVEFILSDKDEAEEWGAALKKQEGNSVTLKVFTPPDCVVGKWAFKVDVVKRQDDKTAVFRYTHKSRIYVLFNPWCKGDTVFMENDQLRQCYVLEDKGKIYAGNYKKISPKPWVFGQFTGNVLDCCMYLLDMSGLRIGSRSNPIPMVRKLTAMINSQDEGGVLTGNWSGDYAGGKSPLSWTGSAPILEQYYRDKFSVQFGQCWVFSGVLTTVLRALGIPARSVTNFASAHDVDTSITIDLHFDGDGNSLEDQNEDSVWNFHVWNECYMARPDLPVGYGGWQALDATPQETSDDVYCCGPMSVRAIKEGEVNLPFDGPFIFAEVNADKVYWQCQQDGSNKVVHIEKNSVGKYISTMSQRGEREDVTAAYKYGEDSVAERAAVKKANLVGSSRTGEIYKDGPKDVEFELVYDAENSFVGGDFEVKLQMTNRSRESRAVFGQINASTMYYTGVMASPVGKEKLENICIKPGECKMVPMTVEPEVYSRKLKDGCMMGVSVMVMVAETKQVFGKKDDLRLRKPHLSIKAPSEGRKGQEVELQVSFTNNMVHTLTDCYLEVEAPGLTTARRHPQSDVPAKGTFMTTITLKPAKIGQRQIIVIFNSRELEDINGSHDIVIRG